MGVIFGVFGFSCLCTKIAAQNRVLCPRASLFSPQGQGKGWTRRVRGTAAVGKGSTLGEVGEKSPSTAPNKAGVQTSSPPPVPGSTHGQAPLPLGKEIPKIQPSVL